ncbi:hypothetical protein BJ875DRAFT_53339 [Amylocarpus encephaloides]|uniref:Uncharacterized protein n=1 Tax=Amylocarpus encephaloides TaxID=45428 RepID=A0A9P8C4I4_9HELO|nr:hypothetical protein BJ875DRAFT_53339 [Amylocarpus encephaloides]
MAPKGPYKLCTVNKAPTRAKVLIGRLIDDLKDEYTIEYAANCETIAEIENMLQTHRPDILFSASMWTPDEAIEIRQAAQRMIPGIKTMAIPYGMQVEQGPDAVVDFLRARWRGVVET